MLKKLKTGLKKKLKTHKKKRDAAQKEETNSAKPSGEPAAKKGRPASIDYEDFVKLWVGAGTVGEVATALGIKTVSASAIANRLRKEGVELKRFPRRGSQPIDVKRLNRLAAGKGD